MAAGKQQSFLDVTSEIGKLQAVLLHKPGKELEKLTPKHLTELLFDDIPWLKKMRKEHDEFADTLRQMGTTIYYVDDLLKQVLENDEVKKLFIQEVLHGDQIISPELNQALFSYLAEKTPEEVAEIAVAGLYKKDLPDEKKPRTLADYVYRDRPQYINAIPNLYFMRDPAAVIGNGISINSMRTEARKREPMIIRYLYDYHPLFKKECSPMWYNCSMPHSIEGGDILVLSKEVIAIGSGERTSPYAIELIAKKLFADEHPLKEILVVHIPEIREFMHLDTVLTMIDRDKFTIYPGIRDKVHVYKLSRQGKDNFKVSAENNLIKSLKKSLKLPALDLIQTGGEDDVTAAREQWNDGTNTLAIAPGVVMTYSRNEVSNEALRKHGIDVVEIEGSELVRGRGGPRCMSMPLVREKL
ncbi:arginine deiminase [Candidatus Formimonas warabiya]|uniref:Arginine deiminase n=1 Tax=Formimonas warabiya TaxID=1761012 RepID=A0A3G1KUY1_FORW1|nr:arginine deiminase [Candidatus Formimonas warabiya]ATW26288.1 arginine deiminase [Candidatus Formimonas warabiya]